MTTPFVLDKTGEIIQIPVAPPSQVQLSDIAYECGVINSLYYAIIEVYHIGRRPHPQQAARENITTVASEIVRVALNEHLENLEKLIATYRSQK